VEGTLRKLGAAAVLAALIGTQGASAARAQTPQSNQTTIAKAPPQGADAADPYLWLEDKDGARALAWVREQNGKSLPVLQSDPHYAALYAQALKINQSAARIPYPSFLHGSIYNFWQDASHVRGIWRRTSLESCRTASPAWHTVLDLDALAKREHANWVWEGSDCAQPQETRCLLQLSDGGEDARTLREFDLTTGRFVPGGFVLPREKQNVTWADANTLLVSRAWKPGQLTTSGYAYVVKRLRRGQPLSSATPVFSGQKSDVSVDPFTIRDGQGDHVTLIRRGVTFFTSEYYIVTPGGLKKLNLPEKSTPQALVRGRLLVSIDQDWNAGGSAFAASAPIARIPPGSARIAE